MSMPSKKAAKSESRETLSEAVYLDVANGSTFRIQTASETGETVLWTDGREYPLVRVEVERSSRPTLEAENAAVDGSRPSPFKRKQDRDALH